MLFIVVLSYRALRKYLGALEVKCRHNVFNAAPLKHLGFKYNMIIIFNND